MNEIFTSATFYLIRKDSNIKFLVSSQSVLSPGVSECVYLPYMFVYYNVRVFSELWLGMCHSFGGIIPGAINVLAKNILSQEQMGMWAKSDCQKSESDGL